MRGSVVWLHLLWSWLARLAWRWRGSPRSPVLLLIRADEEERGPSGNASSFHGCLWSQQADSRPAVDFPTVGTQISLGIRRNSRQLTKAALRK